MRLRQHAVHSNGTQTITYTGCTNTEACADQSYCADTCTNNHTNTGCGNHNNSGYSNHSNKYTNSNGCNWGAWCSVCGASTDLYSWGAGCSWCGDGGCKNTCSNSGCGNHSNSGYSNYSKSGYSNHSNTSKYNNNYVYTESSATPQNATSSINSNIPSYILNSSLSDKGVNLAANIIVLDLSSAYSGGQRYRIYARNATLGGTTFSDWQLVTEQEQISTFSVDISTWAQGQVQFAVTAYNGSSWSAILSNNEWTYDHHQALTNSTNITYATVQAAGGHTTNTHQTSTKTVVTVSDTTQYEVVGGSYALSDVLQIIRYTPPTWLTDPYAKATTQQLQNEINKALDSYTGATHVFASSPIVCNWTMITLNNLIEMQAQTNNILTAAGKSIVDFSSKDYMNGTGKISPDKALKDLQNLLDSLGE